MSGFCESTHSWREEQVWTMNARTYDYGKIAELCELGRVRLSNGRESFMAPNPITRLTSARNPTECRTGEQGTFTRPDVHEEGGHTNVAQPP